MQGINWSQYIDENALLNLPSGQAAPAGFTVGHSYYLGLNNVISIPIYFHLEIINIIFETLFQPNFVYQACTTPRGESGKCRFLQHCARPQIIVSLGTFLSYACPIGNE